MKKKKKIKIGLALGGGGARGYAHLGVIKCFEEYGITFDYIAGTSAGSLVGTLYASGMNYQQMFDIASKLQIKDIKRNKILFMPDSTEGIEKIIRDNVKVKNVEELQIPTSIIAVDMVQGEELDITSGNLAKAVAGSCCVPSVFNPVIFGDKHLCDGGLMNNIPSDVCKKHNCDIVVAVDVNPTRGQGTDSVKLLDILSASLRIMTKANSVKGEMYSDVFIAPNLKKFSSASNEGYLEMIEIGYQTAKNKMPQLLELINPKKSKFKERLKKLFTKKSKQEKIEKFEKNKKEEDTN